MNCFKHPDKSAVGVCKSCHKGLCADCAAELPNGIACRGVCEDRVNLIDRILDNNQNNVAAANAQLRFANAFLFLLGVILCGGGLLSKSSTGAWMMIVPGAVFVIIGALRLRRMTYR